MVLVRIVVSSKLIDVVFGFVVPSAHTVALPPPAVDFSDVSDRRRR